LYQRIGKRLLDLSLTIALLPIIVPLLALAWLAAWLSSGGTGLFAQERMGKNLKPFLIWKLRTMRTLPPDTPQDIFALTVRGDRRIGATGQLLRRWKLDELPQVWNVLRGEMSLVGPRPEVSEWVQRQRDQFVPILKAQPGITSLASIAFINEELVLSGCENPLDAYASSILPRKIALNQLYTANVSLGLDLQIIALTVLAFFFPRQAIHRVGKLASEISTS